MLPIKQNLTTVNYNSMNGKVNKYIVVHYTANTTDTAYNNTRYFKSVNRNASANYFVDDNNIYQCVLDKDKAWHCGDKLKIGNGGAYYGKCTNSNSIGIEMCCTNSDISQTTVNNTIELVKYLMNKYNIPASNVIRHYDVTNKMCPAPMVNDPSRWTSFKNALGGSYTPVAPSKPTGITGDIEYQVYDNVKGQWLPPVINDKDYAGNYGHKIGGFRAKPVYGIIYMQAHLKGGEWLDTINSTTYSRGSRNGNSYSGIFGRDIDGVKIWSSQGFVSYRVHLKGGKWLPWVHKADNTSEGYAGIYGNSIDAIQMK